MKVVKSGSGSAKSALLLPSEHFALGLKWQELDVDISCTGSLAFLHPLVSRAGALVVIMNCINAANQLFLCCVLRLPALAFSLPSGNMRDVVSLNWIKQGPNC